MVDNLLDSIYILVTLNRAAINTMVYVDATCSCLLNIFPEMGFLAHWADLFLIG